jgi:cysteinyl-tRNA synthetase
LHNGWVTFNAEKMSKSIGNVVNVREAIDRVGAQTVRYYLLAPHYRSDLEYSDEGLAEAGRSLERLRIGVGHLNRLLELEPAAGAKALDLDLGAAREEFLAAMDDDFNTPQAVAALHKLVGDVHRATGASDYRPAAPERETLAAAREVLVELGGLLGLDLQPPGVLVEDGGLTEQLLALLVDLRQMARERRQFEIADAVRSRLADLGIILEDHPEGTTWRRREGG